ncbi:MAG: ATP-binding protein [Nevskia sp.]|uniref:ATP-binding protein n=1 Tax=Nevskia sp. TaxID=1929292 RepID=UPI0040364FCE
MLTPDELNQLIANGESDRIERTISTTNTDKFGQAVCAFANDLPNHRQPGYLLIGVADDGHLSGLQVSDQLLQNLSGLRSDGNIQPLPQISVYKVELAGGGVAVVEVQPSDLPPVRYKSGVWVRIGPRKATASEQEERALTERRIARAHSFDASPISEAGIDDLSMALFQTYRQEVVSAEVIAANHRGAEEQLSALRFYDSRNHCVTVAGILLLGKNPRFYLPGAYIQYLQLAGSDLTDVSIDQAEIDGDLLTVMRELDNRIRTGIRRSLSSVSALRESVVTDYPEVAIRELLNNAVLHRDYRSNTPVRFYWFADRIEIQSPGGLYGEVTASTLERTNSYRNPVLAEAMKALGYVNRFGYGIQRAQKALRDNGNPPAEFTIDDRTVLVTIRKQG